MRVMLCLVTKWNGFLWGGGQLCVKEGEASSPTVPLSGQRMSQGSCLGTTGHRYPCSAFPLIFHQVPSVGHGDRAHPPVPSPLRTIIFRGKLDETPQGCSKEREVVRSPCLGRRGTAYSLSRVGFWLLQERGLSQGPQIIPIAASWGLLPKACRPHPGPPGGRPWASPWFSSRDLTQEETGMRRQTDKKAEAPRVGGAG